MTKYFRVYNNEFNVYNTYFVKVQKKGDLYTISNIDTNNILYDKVPEYEKNRLLESWIEYDKNGIKQTINKELNQ